MFDKNGKEIKTGDIVEITGAYFKSDNGLYYVDNSPGDASWSGSDHCLHKISKRGKISKAERNICFWPISVFLNDRFKTAQAKIWNAEHAEIEKKSVADMSEVIEHFTKLKIGAEAAAERAAWDFGEGSKEHLRNKNLAAHYAGVVSYIERSAKHE